MTHKRRLGRGLASLIPTAAPGDGTGVREILLRKIELNPHQPRQRIDAEALKGLSESIKSCGVIQPVVVRPRGELYELAVGERRLRAAKMAGLESVPAIVRELSDEQMLEMALIENIQREDLNAIEKAQAVARMIQELELTQEQAAERLGLNRTTVTNMLRLLELPEDIQHMVSRGTLSAGHARALLAIEDDAAKLGAARRIVSQGLSVREAERLAARLASCADTTRAQAAPLTLKQDKSAHIRDMENTLQRALGARVTIHKRGVRGKIVIHFHGYEEFERIFDMITRRESADTVRKASA